MQLTYTAISAQINAHDLVAFKPNITQQVKVQWV